MMTLSKNNHSNEKLSINAGMSRNKNAHVWPFSSDLLASSICDSKNGKSSFEGFDYT